MGVNYSSSNNLSKDGFRHTIDYIATYYIVTMDIDSLKKLTDREYCNQLIILTSDIISKYATTRDIQYMVKKQGNIDEPNELKTQKVTYFNKNIVDREIPEMVKKEMCMSIASFYIRIAHLFSAIILTINPIYKYRDESGMIKVVKWENKKDIPEGVNVDVEYSNLCNNRINALEPNDNTQKDTSLFQRLSVGSSKITLMPSICHLQFKPNLLIQEPGIKELEALYYDVYDYNEGKYNSMSMESRQQYQEDVHEFYRSFTGKYNEAVPEEIKTFNDIPIKQYSMCSNSEYTEPITISSNNEIYKKYANNLNEMKSYASINQEKLMNIVSKIFVYTINKKTGKKHIRINPRLNDDLLAKLTQDARTYISQLYVSCQKNYDKRVHLYQDIVESVLSKTLDKRIINAENEEHEEMKDIKTVYGDNNTPQLGLAIYNNNNSNQSSNNQYDQPNDTPYDQPNTTPYNQPNVSPYDQLSTSPYNQPNDTPYYKPSTTPYNQPNVSPYDQLSTSPYNQPNDTPYYKPSTTPYNQPNVPPYDQLSTSPYNQPNVPPYDQPSDTPYEQQNASLYDQPNVPPYDKPSDTPYEQQNASLYDQPSDTPYDQPSDTPYDQPNNTLYDQPNNTLYDQPSDTPYDQLSTSPYDQPSDTPYPYDQPTETPYDHPIETPYDQPIETHYDQPIETPYDQQINSDIPTIYTNNDKYEKTGNISVSSLPFSQTKGVSDRDVTEQLNRIEFGRNNNGNISKNNM